MLRNLRRSPGVYLDSVVSGFLTFNLDINSVLLKAFQYLQTPGARLRDSWFDVGHPQTFHPGTLSTVFSVYMSILTALAGGGAWIAWRRKDLELMAPATVYLCLAVGHALTYMDLMYYYQRVPFLYVFVASLGEAGHHWSVTIPFIGFRVPFGPALLEPFLAFSVVLTLWIV